MEVKCVQCGCGCGFDCDLLSSWRANNLFSSKDDYRIVIFDESATSVNLPERLNYRPASQHGELEGLKGCDYYFREHLRHTLSVRITGGDIRTDFNASVYMRLVESTLAAVEDGLDDTGSQQD